MEQVAKGEWGAARSTTREPIVEGPLSLGEWRRKREQMWRRKKKPLALKLHKNKLKSPLRFNLLLDCFRWVEFVD